MKNNLQGKNILFPILPHLKFLLQKILLKKMM